MGFNRLYRILGEVVSYVGNLRTKVFNASEDILGEFGSNEGLGICVAGIRARVDSLFVLASLTMGTTPDLLLSQYCEPAFVLADPGSRCQRK